MSAEPIELAVMLFHKNIRALYKQAWIEKCLQSLFAQTFRRFDLFELCYHPDRAESSLREEFQSGFLGPGQWIVQHTPCADHSVAMNVCLDTLKATRSSSGHMYRAVANVNLDDFYHPMRFELQMAAIVQHGADLVTSSFVQVYDCNSRSPQLPCADRAVFNVRPTVKDRADLVQQMQKVNLIAHPVVMFSTRMWRLYDDICYRQEVPAEDYKLWKRVLQHEDIRIVILNAPLLFYRLHSNQITKTVLGHTEDNEGSSSSSSERASTAAGAALAESA